MSTRNYHNIVNTPIQNKKFKNRLKKNKTQVKIKVSYPRGNRQRIQSKEQSDITWCYGSSPLGKENFVASRYEKLDL